MRAPWKISHPRAENGRAGPFETGSEGNRIQWDAIVIYSPRCDWPPCRTAHVAPIIYKIGTTAE